MKKFFFAAAVLVLALGWLTITRAAPNIGGLAESVANKAGYDTGGVSETTISKTVGGIIRGVLGLVGVGFLALTVYAGVMWMTASGNEERVTKAKSIITSSFIGLVIVAAAYGVTALVMTFVFRAAAPEGNYIPGREDFVDRKMGCCVLEEAGNNNPPCWNFADPGQCTGRWYADVHCNNLYQEEQKSCLPQN